MKKKPLVFYRQRKHSELKWPLVKPSQLTTQLQVTGLNSARDTLSQLYFNTVYVINYGLKFLNWLNFETEP